MFNKSYGMPIPERSPNEVSSNPLCDNEIFVLFVDANIYHKHIFLKINKNNTQLFENYQLPIFVEHDKSNDTGIVLFKRFP